MRPLLLLIFAAFTLSLSAQTNKKIRNLQSQQTELKKKINESEELLRSTKKDVKSQLNNLVILSGQIDEKQKYIKGIEYEVDTLNQSITSLENRLAELRHDLAECKRKYGRSVMYMHRNHLTQNKLMFLFSAEDFRQMYRRMRYVMEYSKYQRAQGNIIREKELAVKEKQDELLATKSLKDQLLNDSREEQKLLESKQQEREQMVKELNKKQSQLQASLRRSRREAQRLNAQIEKLIQEEIEAAERRRKAAEEKARREQAARERAAKKGGTSGKTSTPAFRPENTEEVKLSKDFASNKGRLPMPITGGYVISKKFGQYNVAGLGSVRLDNKGIDITGKRGAQARSIFNGEVATVAQISGMWVIIVRHGSYISLYSNIAKPSVRKGQKVTTRQTLGTVSTDDSGNATLHFQLRKEKVKLNPEHWIGR